MHQLSVRPLPRRPVLGVRPPNLVAEEVVSQRIHPTVDGVRIGQISDVHVRTGVRPRRLHLAVEMMNALKPDLVVLTGDYVCFSARPVKMLTDALRRLQVPAYATLGNHDHWSGAEQVRRALRLAGVEVLTNEHREVRAGRGRFHLVGIDDSVTRNHDPERAFFGVPDQTTRVVLAHDPKLADQLSGYRPALVVSGHTHGGQVRLPWVGALRNPAEREDLYEEGLRRRPWTQVYVSRGVGTVHLPVRFLCRPEVAILHLTGASRPARRRRREGVRREHSLL
jgi:uncharacterized protein